MKLKEASITKGITISIGKYEFLRTEISLTMDGLDINIEELGKEVDDCLQAEIDKTMADLHVEHLKVTVTKDKTKSSSRISRRR